MAHVSLYHDRLEHNYLFLDRLFSEKGIQWGPVTKLLCGEPRYLDKIIDLGCNQIMDSRIYNLKQAEIINFDLEKVYIKPPSENIVENVVRYADISLNTEYYTIRLLSREARKQKKLHKVILMVEMGDLREGILAEQLISLFKRVRSLPCIEIIGIGTNLKCMNGVEPTREKLMQLIEYKKMLESRFRMNLPIISGGTSAMIPMLLNNELPEEINHFRVGETLFFGNNLITEEPIEGMRSDVIELSTQIIELSRKPMVPTGQVGANVTGDKINFSEYGENQRSFRALIDIGTLDINPKFLIPKSPDVKVIGASSDIIAVDLAENENAFRVGDYLKWGLSYMGALNLMSSIYVNKKIEYAEVYENNMV